MPNRFIVAVADSTELNKVLPKPTPNAAGIAYQKDIDAIQILDPDGVAGTFLSLSTKGVAGVAAGYKMARGATALDGSNPTPVTTGLTTIVAAVATLQKTSAVSSGTAFVTLDFSGSDGVLNLYAWVLAGSASTGTETVNWICVGT